MEMLMRIAIIGAGNVASALGRAWLGGGEDVIFGVPNPADPKYRSLPEERLRTAPEAARNAEIIVLATPWPATEAAARSDQAPHSRARAELCLCHHYPIGSCLMSD
jgi:8-hydroxy-5-deazaflavin:NADPH oxidoreductase